jgi:hypothetical protein
VGLNVLLDDNGRFLCFVFFFIVEQPIDILVPDNAVDEYLFEDGLLGSSCEWFGVQAGLKLG